jgi:2-polyprenyl-6-methoxyphenol hydroxylase-like FAD-dependent oxidoreductase
LPGGSTQPVLIVGAGPTGLVLAIEFARRGIPFRLIDRLEAPSRLDRATVVKPRTLEILAALGVVEAFLESGQPVHGVDVFSGQEQAAGYRFAGLDTPYPYLLSIPEYQTEQILTAKLLQLGGRVERNAEFVELKQMERSAIVELRSPGHGKQVLEASWVVGADGIHSPVRQAINVSFDGRDHAQYWAVVDGRIAGWRHSRKYICAQLQPPIAIPFPLTEDRWRIYFRSDSPGPDTLPELEKRLGLISPGAQLRDMDEPRYFKASSRVARAYRTHRVLIAGDAAHASSPIDGHGMNAGIQDAYNLGWKLSLANRGFGSEALVDSYAIERRPVAEVIVKSGDDAEARMATSAVEARQELFDSLSTPQGQEFAAVAESEIAFSYGDSPVVSEPRPCNGTSDSFTKIGLRVANAGPLVGCDAPLFLHDLISTTKHSLLLLLGACGPDQAVDALDETLAGCERWQGLMKAYAAVRTPFAQYPEGILLDEEGKLHERLGGDNPTLCLIRPDGHLGFRSLLSENGAFHDYLCKIFPH